MGVMTCLVPREGGILPNICNLCCCMQSGKPHPEASAWLQNESVPAWRPDGNVGPGEGAGEPGPWFSAGRLLLRL